VPSSPKQERAVRWRQGALLGLLAWSLAMGLWSGSLEPTGRRFWDEQYGMRNIATALRHGSLEPASAHHPTLSYLPQLALLATVDAVAERTGSQELAVLRDGRFTPLAYRLVRATSAAFGTLAVLWAFLVGRRLFDDDVALLGALLLAVVPWHIRQSAIYKPDAQLVFFVLLALDAALRALRTPSWRRYLAAGAAVALAAATKFNGAAAALPLAAGCLPQLPRRPRLLLRLAGAGLAAVAVFAVLDLPLLLQPDLVVEHFGETLQHYQDEGELAGAGRLDMIGHAAVSILSAPFHGPLLGAAALLGLAWIVFRLRGAPPGESPRRIAFLAFPVGYVALYALTTNNPSPHNWLPLAPFTALAAAFTLVEGWRALRRRAGAPATRAAGPVLAALLAGVLAFQATSYAYDLAVPTTWSVADRLLARHLGASSAQRLVLQDYTDTYVLTRLLPRPRRPARASLDDWRRWGLDPALADAVVRVEKGREGGHAGGGRVHRIAAAPFRVRGPRLEVVLHEWRPSGEPVRLRHRGGGRLDPLPPFTAERVTIEVLVAAGRLPEGPAHLVSGDRRLPLLYAGRRGGTVRFVTPRAAPLDPTRPLRVEGVAASALRSLVVRGWERAGPG
jgi:hypothetical protein